MSYVTHEVRTWLREHCARSAEIANLFANSSRAGRDERRICGRPRKRSQEKAEGKSQPLEAVIASHQGQRFMACPSSSSWDHLEFFFDRAFLEPLLICSSPQKRFGEQASLRQRGDEMRRAFYPQQFLQMDLITDASLVSWYLLSTAVS